jgi:N-methylhydantoinase B
MRTATCISRYDVTETRAATDPILSEIVHNHELTVNREMGRAVVNLSGSFLFVGASDFACGCLDADGNILTTIAWSLQMGYAISNTVHAAIRRYPAIHPGDVIFCNDPYDGGGLHAHDVVVVAPVFSGGSLAMWVGVCAHISDVGGALAGGYSVEPMDCYGENIRFTPIKIYDRGEFRPDVLDAFLTNVRVPDQVSIDLKALMGATWIGRERMTSFIDHYGAATIAEVHAQQIAASERALKQRLAALPDGVYRGASHMEHDGRDDRIYTIRATVVKEGEDLTIDFSETDAQAPGVLNCAEVGTVGNVIAAMGTIIAPDIPFNEGIIRPVRIVSPPGTLVNAVKPAPISGATVYGAWFGTDAILEAVDYLIAGHPDTEHRRTGPWGCWTFAWLQSLNQYGEPWFWNVFTGGSGGAGALPFRDGENAMMGIQTIDAFTPNIEDYELQSPVLFLERRFAADTGGAGRHRGGLALESYCVPYEVGGWDVVVFHNRLTAPSSAVSGGYPGAGSAIEFLRGAMDSVEGHWRARTPLSLEEHLPGAEKPPTRAKGLWVGDRDVYYMRATGGPGYGDPLDRDPAHVLADVETGAVSLAIARDAYGVVIAATGVPDGIDVDATNELRASLREERSRLPLGREVFADDGAAHDDADATDVAAQVLGEYLEIDASGRYRCRGCAYDLGPATANWKLSARVAEDAVSPEVIKSPIRTRADGALVMRAYHCPSCSTRIDCEVALRGEAPRWNFMPLSVWKRSVALREAQG